jgi:phosphoribosylanthranilate isomerase
MERSELDFAFRLQEALDQQQDVFAAAKQRELQKINSRNEMLINELVQLHRVETRNLIDRLRAAEKQVADLSSKLHSKQLILLE